MTEGFSAEDEASIALRSSVYFGEVGLGLTFYPQIHHDVLDALDMGQNDETLILMFRGLGKTTMAADYCARRVAEDPNVRGLILGFDEDDAAKIVGLTRQYLQRDQVTRWSGGEHRSKELWNDYEFVSALRTATWKEPTMMAAGLKSLTPGPHFDFAIRDDVENEKTVTTPELRERMRELDSLLVPMVDQGPRPQIVTIGTFYDDADTYSEKIRRYRLYVEEQGPQGKIIKRKVNGLKRTIPLASDDGEVHEHRVQLFYKPIIDEQGNPTFPERFPRWKIESIRTRMKLRPKVFAAQYLLDPVAAEGAKFGEEDFHYVEQFPMIEGDGWIGVDCASSLDAQSDNSGFAVATVTPQFKFYVEEAYAKKLDSRDLIDELFDLHARHPNYRIAIEEDRYFKGLKVSVEEEMLKRNIMLDLVLINAHNRRSKEARIEAMQAIFKMGQVICLQGETETLEDELIRFPRGSKIDVADAFANIYESSQSPPEKEEESEGPWSPWEDREQAFMRRGSDNSMERDVQMEVKLRTMTPEEVDWRLL